MSYKDEMNYKMEVTIENPENNEEQKTFTLDCRFGYDPKQYGNGHSLYIGGTGRFDTCYDLRYDMSFDRCRKAVWLVDWAYWFWSGKDGAWQVRELKIIRE